jgi:UDP-N-acetylmuramoyl-tripeptide--D-alanyl-D-alanine ligase
MYHEEIGEFAKKKNIDLIICGGSLARYIFQGAAKESDGKTKALYYEDKESLMLDLEKNIVPEDIILVKASNGMHFNEIVKNF